MSAARASPLLLLGVIVAGWAALRSAWLYSVAATVMAVAPVTIATGPAMTLGISPEITPLRPAPTELVEVPSRVAPLSLRPIAMTLPPRRIASAGPSALAFDAVQGPLMLRFRRPRAGRFALSNGFAPRRALLADAAPAALPAVNRRWSLSAWGHYRSGDGFAAQATPGAGSLGGSQLGMALRYRLDRDGRLALSARLSSTRGNGGSVGAEGALGLAVRPLAAVPIALVAERRQAIAGPGGRNATVLYAVGGVSDAPVAAGFTLDAYGAAGVVGARRRDAFAEGWAVATRPVTRAGNWRLAIGAGAWGAAQPGVSRVDVGPSLLARSRETAAGLRPRLSVDWRQRVAGDAAPGSGLAVTLGVDF